MSDRYLKPEDLAEMLGVPLQSVYAWNHRGTGPPYVRVGRHVRYRESEVLEWLQTRTVNGPAA